jgi:hypothetical protein
MLAMVIGRRGESIDDEAGDRSDCEFGDAHVSPVVKVYRKAAGACRRERAYKETTTSQWKKALQSPRSDDHPVSRAVEIEEEKVGGILYIAQLPCSPKPRYSRHSVMT